MKIVEAKSLLEQIVFQRLNESNWAGATRDQHAMAVASTVKQNPPADSWFGLPAALR